MSSSTFERLRVEYPVFSFDRYEYEIKENSIKFSFFFSLSDEIKFNPYQLHTIGDGIEVRDEDLDTLAFNLGMIELVSYYKATCSPTIEIRCGTLDSDQESFFQKIYTYGLGEFFYVNNITIPKTLFKFISSGKIHKPVEISSKDKLMIPVGGGKDSVVSLELLKEQKPHPFFINISPASKRTAIAAGYNESNFIKVKRVLDRKIVELNERGFLNGHTPFSAMVAFTASVSAYLNGVSYIALSNENSANEGNIIYSGMEINHQYSKSFEAEKDLNSYIKSYISKQVDYFSFLRPIFELKIAELFTKFGNHFSLFRSCNRGSKEDRWCGNCPKCLFVASILLPFKGIDSLNKLFDDSIFDNRSLEDDFKGLVGIRELKPLECVGTTSEVQAAIGRYINISNTTSLPYLLNLFKEYYYNKLDQFSDQFDTTLSYYDENNLIPPQFQQYLKGL